MANGYFKIDNDIADGLSRLKVSGATFNVLWAIIRNTIGYGRKQHKLSNGFLQKATGLNESTVIRTLHELEKQEIIEIISENSGPKPKIICLNTGNIAILAKREGGTGNSASDSTGNPASNNTGNSATQYITDYTTDYNTEKENARAREASLSNEQPTFEELAALSQQENDEEEEGYEYL